VRDALAAAGRWRTGARPLIREIHVDPHGALTLHTRAPAIAIQLGAPGACARRPAAHVRHGVGQPGQRRARPRRAIHLDARPDHATVAFAKD